MESDILIKKLKEGKLLKKTIYHRTYELGTLYLFMEIKEYIELRGFGAGCTDSDRELVDIIHHPENWKISNFNISEHPWIIGLKEGFYLSQ